MSCPEFVYTPFGRQGIGVIQPQSGLDYPLVKPSEDIRYLLADFYLAYDDRGEYRTGTPATTFPLRIKYLLNVGCEPNDLPQGAPIPVNDADIVIVDHAGVEVLNTATAGATCNTFDWGSDYKIYEWITADAVCRLVAHTTWKTGEPSPQNYAQYLEPVDATLDARTIHKMPKRLRSLRVRQKEGTIVNGPYVGNVRFKNNYNTEIVAGETTTTNFVVNTRVTFSAVAGSGAGYFPVCGDNYDADTKELIPQPIRSINGVGANAAGDFFLSGSDCMYVRRPTDLVDNEIRPALPGTLQMGADCVPCCACAEYVTTALYMNKLRDDYALIGDRVGQVKDIHEANIDKWNEKRACTLENPLKLIMVPQCCPLLDVVLMICNPCQICYLPSTLTLILTAPTINPQLELVCGLTTLYNDNGSTSSAAITTTPVSGGLRFDAQMPAVKAGGTALVKFRVRSLAPGSYPVTGSLTGTFIDGAPIQTGCPEETPVEIRTPANPTKTVTFNCTEDGDDTRPCA